MHLLHVALTASSETNADAFYVGLLGLNKAEPKTVPGQVCQKLFGIARDVVAINYTGGPTHFEVFICPSTTTPPGRVDHTCLGVENLSEFLRKCETLGLQTIRVPKGQAVITFVKDLDGNLFEVKETTPSSVVS